MPIGPYEGWSELRAAMASEYRKKGKKLSPKRLNAITAGAADRMEPGWRSKEKRGGEDK